MTISDAQRRSVRERARFACEYCGVSEIDSGGELTIDHYQPLSKGGTDDNSNLIYCCYRCNQHKAGYWPTQPDALPLWCPAREPATNHFVVGNDGTLLAISDIGAVTIAHLRLSRPSLIARRARRRALPLIQELLTQNLTLIAALEQARWQQRDRREDYQHLLNEQRRVLSELLRLLE